MTVLPTRLSGVMVIEPRRHADDRGWFVESWNRAAFAAVGLDSDFVQDNHSRSRQGVVRGLHYQAPPRAQAKLVRCTAGRIWDVVVDIRHGSPTYGQWDAVELDAESQRMIWVPVGFAHGFCVLSEQSEVQYKCSDTYAPAAAVGIAWDDPALGIPWPVSEPVLSEPDRRHARLAELPRHFTFTP